MMENFDDFILIIGFGRSSSAVPGVLAQQFKKGSKNIWKLISIGIIELRRRRLRVDLEMGWDRSLQRIFSSSTGERH